MRNKRAQVMAAAAKAEAEQQKKVQILAWGVAATMLVIGLAGALQLYNVLTSKASFSSGSPAPAVEQAPAH
jgi:hypothetical protein